MLKLPTGVKKISMVIFPLLVLVVALVFFTKANIERRVKLVIDQKISSIAPFVAIHYGRVAFNPLLWDLHIHDVQILLPHQPPIAIEEIVFENWDRNREHRLPYVTSLQVKNARLPAALLGEQGWVVAWGKETIPFSFALDTRYEENRQVLHVKKIAVEVLKVGQLKLAADFGNVPWQEGMPAVIAKSYASVLQAMTIHYCDDSLLDGIMQAQARQAGTTPELIKQSWLRSLAEKEHEAQGHPQKVQFYASLKNFLRRPGCMSLAMMPNPPLPLGSILQVTSEDELYRLLTPEVTLP